MEILAAAGTAATSLFSAGASAIGSAESAVGGAATSGMSALSGGFSALSGLASIGGGVAKMMGQQGAAADQAFQGRMEEAASGLRLAELKEERNRVIANNMVAAAASGLDVTAGDPLDTARATENATADQLEIEQSNAAMRRYARNRMARASESQGMWSLFDGVVGAGKEMASSRLAESRRGVPANG